MKKDNYNSVGVIKGLKGYRREKQRIKMEKLADWFLEQSRKCYAENKEKIDNMATAQLSEYLGMQPDKTYSARPAEVDENGNIILS